MKIVIIGAAAANLRKQTEDGQGITAIGARKEELCRRQGTLTEEILIYGSNFCTIR
ncbi:MAG: hypothetical protein QHH06_04695 [Clostridiales bacterium]|jgi:hypothetical protein|nr:hypothetical protein [Eubacteriales bacterium]MDH7565766.1 hypothetical protein [Clostridiales bacterium]